MPNGKVQTQVRTNFWLRQLALPERDREAGGGGREGDAGSEMERDRPRLAVWGGNGNALRVSNVVRFLRRKKEETVRNVLLGARLTAIRQVQGMCLDWKGKKTLRKKRC